MHETDSEHATDATGDATTRADEGPAAAPGDTSSSTSTRTEGEAEEGAEREVGPFGGLTPSEASRKRWEAARERDADPEARDPRRRMAQSLQAKAEKGDTRAYEMWRQITDELEAERLARDGADGPKAWEQITPSQRRLLLDVLSGEAVVLQGEDAARWRAMEEEERAPVGAE